MGLIIWLRQGKILKEFILMLGVEAKQNVKKTEVRITSSEIKQNGLTEIGKKMF